MITIFPILLTFAGFTELLASIQFFSEKMMEGAVDTGKLLSSFLATPTLHNPRPLCILFRSHQWFPLSKCFDLAGILFHASNQTSHKLQFASHREKKCFSEEKIENMKLKKAQRIWDMKAYPCPCPTHASIFQ